MPVDEIRFYVLDVGQGSCNYVECYEAGVVVYNMLVDLGTNSSQAIAADNIAWLRQQIEAHGKYLDVLTITHGDTDHYNMIAKILPALGPPTNNQIGKTRYGGPDWRYGGGLIALLTTYTQRVDPLDPTSAINISGYPPGRSSYRKNAAGVFQWYPIWTGGGVELQLILANVPHTRDPGNPAKRQRIDPVAINTKSLVVAVQWHGYWLVATGDATAVTLTGINTLLEGVNPNTLPRVFMLTMPHHGSRKTTYNLAAADDDVDDDALEVVDTFLEFFEPETVSISSGTKHNHPSMLMTNQFARHTNQEVIFWWDDALAADRHFITCWVDMYVTAAAVLPRWPSKWMFATTQTNENVYSTLYFRDQPYNQAFLAPPPVNMFYKRFVCPPVPSLNLESPTAQVDIPMGRNWLFSIGAGNQLSVASGENEARALAELPSLLIAAKSPPASYVTSASRLARAADAASQPPPPMPPIRAAPRSIAEPAGPRLRSLKPIA